MMGSSKFDVIVGRSPASVALFEAHSREFASLAVDYLTCNSILGDMHEYDANSFPMLDFLSVAAREFNRETRMFSLTTGSVQRGAEISKVAYTCVLTNSETSRAPKKPSEVDQEHFIEHENKVALAVLHAQSETHLLAQLKFLDKLLLEGSIVMLAGALMGYRTEPVLAACSALDQIRDKARFKLSPFLNVGWWGRAYLASLSVLR